MKDLNRLREVSDNVLHDLTAGESLKHRILQQAASGIGEERRRVIRLLPAFCGVIAALLVAAIALNGLSPVAPSSSVEMNVFAAGDKETVPPDDRGSEGIFLLPGIDPEDVVSVEISGRGVISDPDQCAALMRTLSEEAQPADPAAEMTAGASLNIMTAEGRLISFEAEDPYLSGDGCWSCPGFFTQFSSLLEK